MVISISFEASEMSSDNPAASLLREEQHRDHLPSWPRSFLTNRQGKSSKNRTLQKNELSPIHNNGRDQFGRTVSLLEGPIKGGGFAGQDKIDMLERRLDFLRSQHTDTLTHLHKEIDRLKAENKEMNFKLVMCRCGTRSSKSRQGISKRTQRMSTPKAKENHSRQLVIEDEVQTLEHSLQKERQRNARLMRVVEKLMQRSLIDTEKAHIDTVPHSVLLIDSGRSPSIQECKEVIRHLLFIGKQQSEELAQLRGDLCDLLYSEDFAADSAQLLGRVQDGTTGEKHPHTDSRRILPQNGAAQETQQNGTQLPSERRHQTVRLPALKPRLPNPISQRQKKTAFLQRTRLGTFPL